MLNTIKIKAKVEESDYIKLIYYLSYSRPVSIISTIIMVAVVLVFSFSPSYSTQSNHHLWVIGLAFVVVKPVGIYFMAKKNYDSNKMLSEEMEYEFNENSMSVQGETFSSTVNWENCHKVTETKSWFILYQSRSTANFIPKDSFEDNIEQFKGLLRSKSELFKVNLKNNSTVIAK